MAKIVKYICDVCGIDENEAIYIVGSDNADVHICNYCLDEMNHRATEYLESRSIDIKVGEIYE